MALDLFPGAERRSNIRLTCNPRLAWFVPGEAAAQTMTGRIVMVEAIVRAFLPQPWMAEAFFNTESKSNRFYSFIFYCLFLFLVYI